MKKITVFAPTALVCLLLFFSITTALTGCDLNNSVDKDSINVTHSTNSITTSTQGTSAAIVTTTTTKAIYEKNDAINSFILRYNSANPQHPIKENDFVTYYHHGRDHDDQIRMWIGEIEIVISQNTYGKNLEIRINLDGGPNATNEDFKELFKRFAKAFCENATEEMLNQYWDETMNDITNTSENEFFESDFTVFNEKVSFITIEG